MDTGDGVVSVFLGKTEESALQTLYQLVELVENGTYRTEVSQSDGDILITNSASKLDRSGLIIQQDGVDGYARVYLFALNNAIKYFGSTYKVDPDADYFDDWDREKAQQGRNQRQGKQFND